MWDGREMTQADLADELDGYCRPMHASTINRIETGTRAVDVDDLVALALALDMTPNWLLFNADDEGSTWAVELTPRLYPFQSQVVWEWANGREPLPVDAVAWDQRERLWAAANRPADVRDATDVTEPELNQYWKQLQPVVAAAEGAYAQGVPPEVVIKQVAEWAHVRAYTPAPTRKSTKKGK